MKKLINSVDEVLAQALEGFATAHGDLVRIQTAPVFVARAAATPAGKVALISGGGSGHEPMHAGLVGLGMLDAACPGQVFTSPTPDQMLAAAQAVDSGAGVLFIVKNYEGDVMNFDMAAEMYDGRHATVLTNDDVAVEDSTWTTGRRGVAGTVSEVNEALNSDPSLVNSDPYNKGWMIKVKLSNPADADTLLGVEDYPKKTGH